MSRRHFLQDNVQEKILVFRTTIAFSCVAPFLWGIILFNFFVQLLQCFLQLHCIITSTH